MFLPIFTTDIPRSESSGFLDNAAALPELELAVSAKNLNIGVLQLTMDFGITNKNILSRELI